jgi:hypothetical protein
MRTAPPIGARITIGPASRSAELEVLLGVCDEITGWYRF